MFLVLLLVLVTSGLSKETSCPNLCTFVYNDPDWADKGGNDTDFTANVESGTLGPGIVTAEYVIPSSGHHDFLRFHTGTPSDEPLALQFLKSRIRVLGYYLGNIYGEKYFDIPEPSDYIQITDQNSDNYVIIIGDTSWKSKVSLSYNYGSEDTWTIFQSNNVRLRDVTKIVNVRNSVTVFKYISICPDATPRLCDDQLSTVKEAKLGEPYTLTCSATGAPFLAASWIKDGEIKPSSHSYVSDGPDHKITSNIDIRSFTVDDIGKWTCSIFNKNFGDAVKKTHDLRYSWEVKIKQSPSENFYIAKVNRGTTFEWIVTGWPFDQVTLDCNDVDNRQLSTDKIEHPETDPPSVNLKLTLQKEDQVSCIVKDGTKVLETANITRVGQGCVVGEKGVGKDCEVCSIGETSVEGSADCFAAESDCQEGFYGIGGDCLSCPEGKSSPSASVKIQECLKISNNSKANIPLVIGASIVAALFTAGLILLVPRLKREYKRRMSITREGGKEESIDKTQEPRPEDLNAETTTDFATTNNQEKTDNTTRKTEETHISGSLAYEDGTAREKGAPPLPPRKEGPPREVTKKKTGKTHKGKSSRKSQFQRDLEGSLSSQVASKTPDVDYIDNTIVPKDFHYYEDLDNVNWALPEEAENAYEIKISPASSGSW